ncbi:MAG: nucleoside deaminase [bacterium]|nr:nucleoside deaminase [bacterium]
MEHIWAECLRLCLESLKAGSLAIAAVITDTDGTIVSRGRNQLFDDEASCNTLRNTLVSHAEINALANLPNEYRNAKDLSLFTTVEPCPMCMGALAMSHIRNISVASKDRYAGATRLLEKDWYLSQKNFRVSFQNSEIEKTFTILHFVSLMVNRKLELEHAFFTKSREIYQEYYEMSVAISQDDSALRHIVEAGSVL